MDLASSENPVMTQVERSHLQRRALWNAVGGGIFIVIWLVATIAILSASNSPSAAPPIVIFGLLLFLAAVGGLRDYPLLQRAYVIWQDVRGGQVEFDVGTIAPRVFAAGRNTQIMLVVDGNRTYFMLDLVLHSIRDSGGKMDGRYCLRIAPRSRIAVNAVSV
jgi:hypothetical protein